jgi:hypothetical protein
LQISDNRRAKAKDIASFWLFAVGERDAAERAFHGR